MDDPAPSRPNPDPSVLTTAQLLRELQSLRDILEARMDAMDKAVALLQSTVGKSPSIAEVSLSVEDLKQLHNEKFRSIDTQLKERDSRTEQTSRDSKVAVDAAFAAAKEAVLEQNKSNALSISKSEAATTKQLDQIGLIINAMTTALNDKIDDLKSRITSAESRKIGGDDNGKAVMVIVGITLSSIIGLMGIALAIMGYVGRHTP